MATNSDDRRRMEVINRERIWQFHGHDQITTEADWSYLVVIVVVGLPSDRT